MERVDYKIYPTLLDSFSDYLNSDDIYERYYGFAENPSISIDDFREKQYQSLIDKINRVPFESEAADRGTAFNEVIDCMILHHNSTKMKIERWEGNDGSLLGVQATLRGKDYTYPLALVKEVASWYNGGLPQQYVEAILPTTFGKVLLYGYVDYVMPFKTCDLKTTSSYWVGKFKKKYQHIVYPYALAQNGADVRDFEYNIVEWRKNGYETYTESYLYRPERDNLKLVETCDDFIRFLQDNKSKITDRKIFAEI